MQQQQQQQYQQSNSEATETVGGEEGKHEKQQQPQACCDNARSSPQPSGKNSGKLRSATLSACRSALLCLRRSDSGNDHDGQGGSAAAPVVQLSESDRQELVVAHRYLWICVGVLVLLVITAVNLLPHKFNFPIHPSVILLTVPSAVCIIGIVTGCCLYARVYHRNRARTGRHSCCGGRASCDRDGYLLQPMLHHHSHQHHITGLATVPRRETQESLADQV